MDLGKAIKKIKVHYLQNFYIPKSTSWYFTSILRACETPCILKIRIKQYHNEVDIKVRTQVIHNNFKSVGISI